MEFPCALVVCLLDGRRGFPLWTPSRPVDYPAHLSDDQRWSF